MRDLQPLAFNACDRYEMTMGRKPEFTAEAAVIGGGPSGLVAALALAAGGAETVLFAPPAPADRRTTALLGGSVRVLETLGVWRNLPEHSAPLERLRIVDATGRLIRAPEVIFHAAELGLEAFGHNVPNEILRKEMLAKAREMPLLRVVYSAVDSIITQADKLTLRVNDREEIVRFAVAADGRNSLGRKVAGIVTRRMEFPQAAIALNVSHTRPHKNISTEFHTESGPFTLVPLPGQNSSIVCVEKRDAASELLALDDAALAFEMEKRSHSMLGEMKIFGGRGSFPLGLEVAVCFARNRIALVGEAGHTLPPIGAQGLNLGIRDAATIAEIVTDAKRAGEDPGSDTVLERYHERRSADVNSRALAVEMMNRSLLTDFLPVQAMRSAGFDMLSRIGFVRKRIMREGLAEREDAPRLARGEVI